MNKIEKLEIQLELQKEKYQVLNKAVWDSIATANIILDDPNRESYQYYCSLQVLIGHLMMWAEIAEEKE